MQTSRENTDLAILNQLLKRILQAAEIRKLKQKDLARIAAFRPEDLSRMKRRGDAWVSDLDRLARHVGLKLALVSSDEPSERNTLLAAPAAARDAGRPGSDFGVRQNEKAADRAAITHAVASGAINVKESKAITSFIKNAKRARIVRDWDGEPWHE